MTLAEIPRPSWNFEANAKPENRLIVVAVAFRQAGRMLLSIVDLTYQSFNKSIFLVMSRSDKTNVHLTKAQHHLSESGVINSGVGVWAKGLRKRDDQIDLTRSRIAARFERSDFSIFFSF